MQWVFPRLSLCAGMCNKFVCLPQHAKQLVLVSRLYCAVLVRPRVEVGVALKLLWRYKWAA